MRFSPPYTPVGGNTTRARASSLARARWFDLVLNSQWKTEDRDYEWWSTTFRENVANIGRTLVVFSPWNDPVALKRAWCAGSGG